LINVVYDLFNESQKNQINKKRGINGEKEEGINGHSFVILDVCWFGICFSQLR